MALSRLRAFAAAGSFALFSGSAAGSRGVQAALQLQRAVTDDVATSLQRQVRASLAAQAPEWGGKVLTADLPDVEAPPPGI